MLMPCIIWATATMLVSPELAVMCASSPPSPPHRFTRWPDDALKTVAMSFLANLDGMDNEVRRLMSRGGGRTRGR